MSTQREIKFRMFDSERNKMHYCDVMEPLDNGLLFLNSKFDLEENHNDDEKPTIMQYTGMRDENGKEIYESDILKHEWRTISRGKYFQSDDAYCEHEELLQVKWIAPSYRFINKEGKQRGLPKEANIKVIGNIYENIELLKQKP